jgi:hypothetical protein
MSVTLTIAARYRYRRMRRVVRKRLPNAAQGHDPAHGGKAKDKRAASQSKRARERAEWEAVHGDGRTEREHFIREIQPKLAGIPLRRIANTTGFSLRYASLVRDGEYVPHPVHI